MSDKPITSDRESRYCQTHLFARLENRITGRVVVESGCPTRFLIPPSWSIARGAAAIAVWRASERFVALSALRYQAYLHATSESLLRASTREDFCDSLNKAMAIVFEEERFKSDGYRLKTCLVDLLFALWRSSCAVWPRGESAIGKFNSFWRQREWGAAEALVESVAERAFTKRSSHRAKQCVRRFSEFLLTRSFVADIADVCPGATPLVLEGAYYRELSFPLKIVIALQCQAHPEKSAYQLTDFVARAGAAPNKLDPEFAWAIESERLRYWAEEARAFIATVKRGRELAIISANFWLNHVLVTPNAPANPVSLFSMGKQEQQTIVDGLVEKARAENLLVIKAFLQSSLERACGCLDDHDRVAIAPGFSNPLRGESPTRTTRQAETYREPMPLRFVNLCQKILTEDDFAWPKKIARDRTEGDWISFKNPDTGRLEEVWSPVRCFALLAKLMLPARTYQIRMLDSGEGDHEIYDVATGRWSTNAGPLAPSAAPKSRSRLIQNGVFRKYQRKDSSFGSLIFFNTNKTADIDSGPSRRGYVMPWEHADALQLFSELRAWQQRYNPLGKPTAWASVKELRLRDGDELKRWGGACFLFRDPSNIDSPTLPISAGRVQMMWRQLMAELERRLRDSGERLPNGEAIALMNPAVGNRSVATPIFDLHSLRVTMITALYEQGVPPEFIMKVAGHASVLMTLYYVKKSGEDITRTLDKARERQSESEQTAWIGYLQGKSDGELKQITARGHDSAVDAFSASRKAGLVMMDHGFCPMSAQRCGQGLVISEESTALNKFAAVPGGPSNCVRCRFFITGPAFLGGLEAHFNDLAYKAQSASRDYEKAQRHYEETLDLDARAAESGAAGLDPRRLSVAQSTYEKAAAKIDALLLSMHAAYRLVGQCVEIANREIDAGGEGFALLVPGSGAEKLQAILQETTAFEQLNRICESAQIYQGLQMDVQLASVQRMRCFDRMLSDHGLDPVFCLIENDDIASAVANEMARFITAGLAGRPESRAKKGSSSLVSLGFKTSFPALFSETKARIELDLASAREPSRRIIPILSLGKGDGGG